jgi:hypothetical protein
MLKHICERLVLPPRRALEERQKKRNHESKHDSKPHGCVSSRKTLTEPLDIAYGAPLKLAS